MKRLLSVVYFCAVVALRAQAQLVADGATNVIDAVTNTFPDPLVVGANGSFTLLVATNASVINSGVGTVGATNSANSNQVVLTGQSSAWNPSGGITIGDGGAFNLLVITNRSKMNSTLFTVGKNGGSDNLVVITDTNSSLSVSGIDVGFDGARNQFMLQNHASVSSGAIRIGFTNGSRFNSALVTGPGSQWVYSTEVSVGFDGANSQLVVSNGASLLSSSSSFQNYIGRNSSSFSNEVIISGGNSRWMAGGVIVGTAGSLNQMLVTNGGTLQASTLTIGGTNTANSNLFLLTTSNSLVDVANAINIGIGGSNNVLSVTNGGKIIGSADAAIGMNGGRNNSMVVSGSNSVVVRGGGVEVGFAGVLSQLLVENGGRLQSGSGIVGYVSTSHDNVAIVTGLGAQWTNSADLMVGCNGTNNMLIVSNGATVFNNVGHVGTNSSGNTAIVTGTNSTWVNRSDFFVGYAGSANQVIVTNGGKLVSAWGRIGGATGRSGSSFNRAIISGAGSYWTNSSLSVGVYTACNSNSLIISDGGVVASLGCGVGGAGNWNTALITGEGSQLLTGTGLGIGAQGSNNSVVISNGALVFAQATFNGTGGGTIGDGSLSPAAGNSMLVTGAGSKWVMNGGLSLGRSQSPGNQLIISNGGVVMATNCALGGTGASLSTAPKGSSNCLVTIADGTLVVTNLSHSAQIILRESPACAFMLNGGLVAADSILVTGYYYHSRGDAYYNPSNRFILGHGTLRVGALIVDNKEVFVIGDGTNRATLQLTDRQSSLFFNHLCIANAGLLVGDGYISGNITNQSGGTLSPGDGIGNMTAPGKLVLSDGSTNIFELNHAASTNDSITGMTNVTYAGVLTVTNLAGTPTNGTTFRLFSAASYVGAFGSLIAAPPAPGLKWNLNRLSVDGVLRVVPEPSIPPIVNGGSMPDATHLVISATQGVAYDPVYLLSATNLGAPLSSWDYIATNQFDATGNASFTNTINSDEPMRYFLLSVP